MRRCLIFYFYLLIGIGWAMAQSSKISGIVVSSEDNEPIVGASIMVEGTKTGTITDIDGRFTLNVAEGVKLQISYIGMKTTVVKAKKIW